MKKFILFLNCMLCLLPAMASGSTASETRTTPTNAHLLTCRALLSHVNQGDAAARTLLRLLDYGLKTTAPDGAPLLSPAELSEILKSEKPVNPKKSPNNSIARTYYVSLQKALEALHEAQWEGIKTEVSKILSIEKSKDEVVDEAEARSDMFFSGTLLVDRQYFHAKHVASYKDRLGKSYFVFIDDYNMSMVVARDDQEFRAAKIHKQEIKGYERLEVPVNPVFYESNDGVVILIVASMDAVLFYPISENGFGELKKKVVVKSPRPESLVPSRYGEIQENVTALGLYKDDAAKTTLVIQSRMGKTGLGFDSYTHYSQIVIEDLLTTNTSKATWLAISESTMGYELERLSVVSYSKDQLTLKQPLMNLVIDESVSPAMKVSKRFQQTIDVNRNNTVDVNVHEYVFGGLETAEHIAYYQLPSGDYLFARTIGEKLVSFELEVYISKDLRPDSVSQLIMKTKVEGNNILTMHFHEFSDGHIVLLVQGVKSNVGLYSIRGSFMRLWGKQHE